MAYGDTWTQSATGTTDLWAFSAINSDGSKIFAYNATDDKIYISVDQGATFSETATQPGDNTRRLDCISSNGSIVYVIAYDALGDVKLYKSANSGGTWSDITETGYGYALLGYTSCSADGQTLYSCADDGAAYTVLKSTNAGSSWTPLSPPVAGNAWCSGDGQIVVSNAYDDPNYVSYLSVNGGSSWATISDLGALPCSFAAFSNDGSVIYVVADDGLYVSTDSGANFTITTVTAAELVSGRRCGCSSDGKYAVALSLAPPDPFGLYVTEDFGATWTEVETPQSWLGLSMSGDGTTMIAGILGDGIYYSVNVLSAFSIISITPSTGSTAGGTPVTIVGEGFDPAATAAIDGNDLTDVTVVDSTTITGITPAGTVGAKDVTVTNP